MSKIIGVTVGTPTSPKRIENEIKPVKTVNGKEPDEAGNIEVGFATDEEVETLLENIYGDTPTDGGGDSGGDSFTDESFATDEEVSDMLDDIFGT